MAGLVIRNADWVVTVDPARRILRDGAIAIVDDRISFVGKSSELPADCAGMEMIDASGLLVLPGFVDTHVHNTQHLG
jgi:cytosine/adenosine deaminase-related metal-dependent hydrolase